MKKIIDQEQPFRQAQDLMNAGELEKALPLIKKAIEINDTMAGPHVLLGHYYNKNGNPELALKSYTNAIERNLQWAVPYFQAAQCLLQLGKKEEGLNLLRQAVKLDPSLKEAYHLLIDQLLDENKLAESFNLLEEALRHHPTDGKINFMLAEMINTTIWGTGKILPARILTYLNAAESDGINPASINRLRGYYYTNAKDWNNAAKYFKESLKHELDEDTAHNCAACLQKAGHTEEFFQMMFDLHKGLMSGILPAQDSKQNEEMNNE